MPDSESNQPVERRHAAPLQVAADMLARSEHEIEADRLREAHSQKATSSTPATSGASTGSPDRAVADNMEPPTVEAAEAAANEDERVAAETRWSGFSHGTAAQWAADAAAAQESSDRELSDRAAGREADDKVAAEEQERLNTARAEAEREQFVSTATADVAAETSPGGSTFAEKHVAADRETVLAQLATERTEANERVAKALAEAERLGKEAEAERENSAARLAEAESAAKESAAAKLAEAERKIALAENDARIRVEVALTEAKRLVEQANVDAKRRVAEAIAQAERLTLESKREAQERVSQAVAAAWRAAEEKLREAERSALEWISAAEAEADGVAATSIMVANQYSETIPLAQPAPLVDEYIDEKPDDKDSGNPKAVDESWALAPKTKRVVRKK